MKTYFVDSFTNQKFKGNPAAVCLTDSELDTTTMQNIATEIGFSETAFIKQMVDNIYHIRFFTPKQEIALCGHATLASSKIIFDTTGLQTIKFLNHDNVELNIRKAGNQIVMQFPVYETEAITVPQQLLSALGIEQALNTRFSPKNKIILVEMTDSDKLAGLHPDFSALLQSYQGISGVLVTARSNDQDHDFHYRYFWPWAGTNEDPVTGAVHTFLTKYWATKLNKNRLNVFQSSLRTGIMNTELLDDTVLIYGEAVTILEGIFKL